MSCAQHGAHMRMVGVTLAGRTHCRPHSSASGASQGSASGASHGSASGASHSSASGASHSSASSASHSSLQCTRHHVKRWARRPCIAPTTMSVCTGTSACRLVFPHSTQPHSRRLTPTQPDHWQTIRKAAALSSTRADNLSSRRVACMMRPRKNKRNATSSATCRDVTARLCERQRLKPKASHGPGGGKQGSSETSPAKSSPAKRSPAKSRPWEPRLLCVHVQSVAALTFSANSPMASSPRASHFWVSQLGSQE